MCDNAGTPEQRERSPDQPSPPAGAWMETRPVPEAPCYYAAVEHSFGGPTKYEAEAPTPEEARQLLQDIEADLTVCPEPAAEKADPSATESARQPKAEATIHDEAEHTSCPELVALRETNEALERSSEWWTAKAEELKVTVSCLRDEADMMREAAEKWREKHAALRAVLAILLTEITALPQCFSCRANVGHFSDCPVGKAREVLEGEDREKGVTDGD